MALLDGRRPGDTVQYYDFDNKMRSAVVQRWVESTIIAHDTLTGKQVVFDQSDHKQWKPAPSAAELEAENATLKVVLEQMCENTEVELAVRKVITDANTVFLKLQGKHMIKLDLARLGDSLTKLKQLSSSLLTE